MIFFLLNYITYSNTSSVRVRLLLLRHSLFAFSLLLENFISAKITFLLYSKRMADRGKGMHKEAAITDGNTYSIDPELPPSHSQRER